MLRLGSMNASKRPVLIGTAKDRVAQSEEFIVVTRGSAEEAESMKARGDVRVRQISALTQSDTASQPHKSTQEDLHFVS